MKYVTLDVVSDTPGDVINVRVRPEHVSDVEDHPTGGSRVTMSHGKEYHVGGSGEQVTDVLERAGEEIQQQHIDKIDELMAKLIPVFNDIERRLKLLEAK